MSAEGSEPDTEHESCVKPDNDSKLLSDTAIGGTEDVQGTGSKSRLSETFHKTVRHHKRRYNRPL